jgi:hypothetical protein
MAREIPPGTYLFSAGDHGSKVTAVRWRQDTVNYRIDDNTLHWPMSTSVRVGIRLAAHRWNTALGDRLAIKEVTAGRTDVVFTLKQVWPWSAFGGFVGNTDLIKDGASPVEDTVRAETWLRNLIEPWLNGMTAEAAALHEWGHVLGVRGHPLPQFFPLSIMTEVPPRNARLTAADVASVRWIYDNM